LYIENVHVLICGL